MDQYTVKDFGKIIKKNAQNQRHELLPTDTNVFRIYDRNQEDFPVTVDLYSDYARVQVYSDNSLSPEVEETIIDQINRMAYVDRDKVIVSYRAKREKGQQHEKTDSSAVIVNVRENGLNFKTDLTSYADTGLFLDHINTRAMIKEMSAGLNVLNLFSYTGSFSVYAASGRAASVTSVDLSATYTLWAQENLKANGFEGDNYKCINCDATEFVRDELKKEHKYDIIIFDPPAFSNSHKMEEDFDVQKDFYVWIKNLRGLLTKNGVIMFSTNLGSFKMDKRRLRGFNVKETTNQLWAEGFVKGRKGTTRSWLMAMDDNSLTLDWSEDEGKKTSENRRDDSPRRDYHKRDGREDHRNNYDRYDRKSNSDRPRREYREHSDNRNRRDFENRNERRFDDRKPRYEHKDRDYRDDYRRSDRPRYEHRDREDRRFDDRRHESSRPRYEHRDRDDRRFDRKPRYEHSDYESKHRFTDRSEKREEKPRREYKEKKPYGYDSFKPARSRDDSPDFFWNED